jgi:signal-transduction protein with cAMP-binding, CBS, and nucleotidyltransferase domain
MQTGITVADAMTQRPITVSPQATLKQCAALMAQKKTGSVVVADKRGDFIGIITERDLVRKVLAKGLPAGRTRAKDIMEETIITISPEEDIFEALSVMRDADIRHLPVVQDGRLLGLVTMKDILKIEPDLFDILVQKFELREEARKPVFRQYEKEGVCGSCGKYDEELTYQDGVMLCSDCAE